MVRVGAEESMECVNSCLVFGGTRDQSSHVSITCARVGAEESVECVSSCLVFGTRDQSLSVTCGQGWR